MLASDGGVWAFGEWAKAEAVAARTFDGNGLCFLGRVLDAAACERTLALASELTFRQTPYDVTGTVRRRADVAYVLPTSKSRYLYETVENAFKTANAWFDFAVTGLAEPVMLALYRNGGHFHWHTDLLAAGQLARKASLSIELSDPVDYEGGELEFLLDKVDGPDWKQGCGVVFPSYVPHRVAKVKKGRRLSLVAWASGPAFR